MNTLKQSDSLKVAVELDATTRIATLTLSGVLTAANLRWYCNEALPRGIAGYITRAQRLIIACEAEDAKGATARPDLALVPGAIVAPPAGLEFAETYARELMLHGTLRKAFLSVAHADAWVRDQVQLRQAQAHWRHLRSAA